MEKHNQAASYLFHWGRWGIPTNSWKSSEGASDNEFVGIFGRFFELRQKTARTDNIQEIIDAFTLADFFFSFPKKTLAFLGKDFAHETC